MMEEVFGVCLEELLMNKYYNPTNVDKIKDILCWSEMPDNEWFDCSFVNSLKKQNEERGFLTEKQELALDKLYKKFVTQEI
jgi:hypothetical protein